MGVPWEVTETKPKDIRGLSEELITEAKSAVEDGKVRKAPASDDVKAAVKAAGRYVREFFPGKSVRSRERDGVVHWWVADKIVREQKKDGAEKPAKAAAEKKAAAANGGSALSKAAAAVTGR